MNEKARKLAKKAAQRFLDSWQLRDWDGMYDATQLSWRDIKVTPGEAAKWLEKMYGWRTIIEGNEQSGNVETRRLKRYLITSSQFVGKCACDVNVTVEYAISNGTSKRIKSNVTLRTVCEDAPYRTNPNGKWGVNPVSGLKETDVEVVSQNG